MMITPDQLIESLNHMALHAAVKLTTLHFLSHFLFHVYNLSIDLSMPFWHLADHSSSTSSSPNSSTPQPTLPHSVSLHLSRRSHNCHFLLCKNDGILHDQLSHSRTKFKPLCYPQNVNVNLFLYSYTTQMFV